MPLDGCPSQPRIITFSNRGSEGYPCRCRWAGNVVPLADVLLPQSELVGDTTVPVPVPLGDVYSAATSWTARF